jgi:hypothetical protein
MQLIYFIHENIFDICNLFDLFLEWLLILIFYMFNGIVREFIPHSLFFFYELHNS